MAKENQKKKRRFGDRYDGRRVRNIDAIQKCMPFIMPKRDDSLNYFEDYFDVSKAEVLCRNEVRNGRTNFSILHVFISAYIRMICERPATNRFVSGQRIYTKDDTVDVCMTVKKKMTLDSDETCIKVHFNKDDTIEEVYEKFNAVVLENIKETDDKSDFEKLNRIVNAIPRLLCRFAIGFLNFLDYFGILPKKIIDLSPFHGSMIITSMGSLGIKPIYHHIYNFGNLPVFISYGKKEHVNTIDDDGNVVKERRVGLKMVLDERICNGYYYASAFKVFKKYFENPELLYEKPKEIVKDLD